MYLRGNQMFFLASKRQGFIPTEDEQRPDVSPGNRFLGDITR